MMKRRPFTLRNSRMGISTLARTGRKANQASIMVPVLVLTVVALVYISRLQRFEEIVSTSMGLSSSVSAVKTSQKRDMKKEEDEDEEEEEELYYKDSSTATVMGMASGYKFDTYRKFVGSLRMTGYSGHIILGVQPDLDDLSKRYLKARNVTIQYLDYAPCAFEPFGNPQKDDENTHLKERNTCVKPYVDIKLRWSRFPLARDWLEACETCTGPVLITDVRDVYFQADPFGPQTPIVKGLHVFEEHESVTTTNWMVSHPIPTCKGVHIGDHPMICSGTTIGTRESMIEYINVMYDEFKLWMKDEKCHFQMNGDDQSIHNYLYYTGKLPFATSFPFRTGIVNTIGALAARIRLDHIDYWKSKGKTQGESMAIPYRGANFEKNQWIDLKMNLTDDRGYLTNFDGTRSPVVHQLDRWGQPFYIMWLEKQPFYNDEFK